MNEFICQGAFLFDGHFYRPGDTIDLGTPRTERAPVYICLQKCSYKGEKYFAGAFGYFRDEPPPAEFFAHLHDFDKYRCTYSPTGEKIFVRKEE